MGQGATFGKTTFRKWLKNAICRGSLRVREIRRDQPIRQLQEEAKVQSIERLKTSNRAVGYCQKLMFSSCTTRARAALEYEGKSVHLKRRVIGHE